MDWRYSWEKFRKILISRKLFEENKTIYKTKKNRVAEKNRNCKLKGCRNTSLKGYRKIIIIFICSKLKYKDGRNTNVIKKSKTKRIKE